MISSDGLGAEGVALVTGEGIGLVDEDRAALILLEDLLHHLPRMASDIHSAAQRRAGQLGKAVVLS